MRAGRFHRRADLSSFRIDELPPPSEHTGGALVKIEAAAITPGELSWEATWTTREGTDRLPVVPAHEFVGTLLSASGRHKKGTRVYGLIDFYRDGAAREIAFVKMNEVAAAPCSISNSESAALPLSALTAWQGLFVHGELSAGESVLIHGGAGAVGSIAVQLAKNAGAHVITTASQAQAQVITGFGADQVVDYAGEPFEDAIHRPVDLVFDTVGGKTLRRSVAITADGGRLVSIVEPSDEVSAAGRGVVKRFFVVRPDADQLEMIASLVDQRRVRSAVDRVFPLEELPLAFEHLERRKRGGKVVIAVAKER